MYVVPWCPKLSLDLFVWFLERSLADSPERIVVLNNQFKKKKCPYFSTEFIEKVVFCCAM